MLKVLDHPLGARSRTSQPYAPLIARLLLSFAVYLCASSCLVAVSAQDAVDGRVHTQGLSILDNPQPNSILNAGSDTDISIDVSAFTNDNLVIDSLEVYLVSSEAQKNLTVSSSGPEVLSQEPGSTVKHIHWSVPACLQSGVYNLTLYEASHLNDTSFFAITPIPVQIRNNGDVSDSCDTPENALEAQHQLQSPPPPDVLSDDTSAPDGSSPDGLVSASRASQTATDSATTTASANSTASANTTQTITSTSSEVTGTAQSSSPPGNIITVTAGDGNITAIITSLPGTIVVEPSGGAPSETGATVTSSESEGFITIFKTIAPTATETLTEIISAPVTITLEETYVSTITASGTTEEFTVTQTIVSTTELFATQISSPQQAGQGLLPINAGSKILLSSALLLQSSLLGLAFMYVAWPLL